MFESLALFRGDECRSVAVGEADIVPSESNKRKEVNSVLKGLRMERGSSSCGLCERCVGYRNSHHLNGTCADLSSALGGFAALLGEIDSGIG